MPLARNDPIEQTFISLNNSMCSTPVLVVPNLTMPFVVECDTSGTGLGSILTQEGRPITFTSKKLCDRNLGNSTYDKEIMDILHVVDTSRPYLLGFYFQIKTDHHGLKYFLEQQY